LRLRVLFVGLNQRRVKNIVSAIESAADVKIDPVAAATGPRGSSRTQDCQAVFVSRDLKEHGLVHTLQAVTEAHPQTPVVLVYGAEPDGKTYLYANKYGCMLFSELDRLGRTLTACELAETLQARSSSSAFARKLMELSMSYGPCSTGD
jgi:hypothetical protein